MQMAIIGLQKGTGKRSRVREKSVKSQGILIWIMSGNPGKADEAETWHTCIGHCPLQKLCFLFRSDKNSGCYGNL